MATISLSRCSSKPISMPLGQPRSRSHIPRSGETPPYAYRWREVSLVPDPRQANRSNQLSRFLRFDCPVAKVLCRETSVLSIDPGVERQAIGLVAQMEGGGPDVVNDGSVGWSEGGWPALPPLRYAGGGPPIDRHRPLFGPPDGFVGVSIRPPLQLSSPLLFTR